MTAMGGLWRRAAQSDAASQSWSMTNAQAKPQAFMFEVGSSVIPAHVKCAVPPPGTVDGTISGGCDDIRDYRRASQTGR